MQSNQETMTKLLEQEIKRENKLNDLENLSHLLLLLFVPPFLILCGMIFIIRVIAQLTLNYVCGVS